jgi:glycosyltransferase involved in cell wall biosynthesis
MKYRILLVGDNPLCPTGYGVQLKELGKYLLSRKHEVIFFDTAFQMDEMKGGYYRIDQFCKEYFSKSKNFNIDLPLVDCSKEIGNGVICFKRNNTTFPFNDIPAIVKEIQADIFILLKDINNYPPNLYLNIPSITWCPLDAFPVSPSIIENLDKFNKIISISEYGKNQFIDYGFDSDFISHSLNTDLIDKINKKNRIELRKKYNLPQDKFIVSMIASNTESNDRKGWSFNIQGFKKFSDKYGKENIHLFLNTNIMGLKELDKIQTQKIGVDIKHLLDYLKIDNYSCIPTYKYRKYTQEEIYEQLKLSDILLNCSRGEGCGVVLLESQSVGTPVITSKFTAMEENCINGELVDPYCLEYRLSDSFHCIPNVDQIASKLEKIYLEPSKYRDNIDIINIIKDNTNYKKNGDKFLKIIEEVIIEHKLKNKKLS